MSKLSFLTALEEKMIKEKHRAVGDLDIFLSYNKKLPGKDQLEDLSRPEILLNKELIRSIESYFDTNAEVGALNQKLLELSDKRSQKLSEIVEFHKVILHQYGETQIGRMLAATDSK